MINAAQFKIAFAITPMSGSLLFYRIDKAGLPVRIIVTVEANFSFWKPPVKSAPSGLVIGTLII